MSSASKVCVFCQIKRDISKEHIIPKWADYLFRDIGAVWTFHEFDSDGTRLMKRRRQGSPAKTQVRAVCRVCNQGWMKAREELCRPFLERLATSQPTEITVDDQAALAQWVCMKLMVAERSRSEAAVFKQPERTALMNDGAIPKGVTIILFQCLVRGFQSIYCRDSAIVSPIPKVAADKAPPQNVATWVIGFRNLLIFASYFEPSLPVRLNFDQWPGRRLHPSRGNQIDWPPENHLRESAARQLTSALRRSFGGASFDLPVLPS